MLYLLMGYQSKTYSLSDDVIEKLAEVGAEHGSVNRALLYLLDMNVLGRKKPSKKAAHVAALRASDPLGADREDIEHGNMELPSGGSVALGLPPLRGRVHRESKSDAYQARGMRPKGAGKDR